MKTYISFCRGVVLYSGLFLSICSANINITEVFYDGNDERVELTNTDTTFFSGQVTLLGAKSSPLSLTLSLLPGESKIRGDEGSVFQQGMVTFVGGQGLQLSDTTGRTIELLGEGVHDVFFASKDLVEKQNNLKTALCNSPTGLVDACMAQDTRFVLSGVVASPGWVDISLWLPFVDTPIEPISSTGDVESFPAGEEEVQTDTGDIGISDEPGDIPINTPAEEESHSPSSNICENTGQDRVFYQPSPLFITKIYPFSDGSGSYIEVYVRGTFSGNLAISGAGAGESSKLVYISGETGEYISIVSTGSWGDIVLTGMSLRDEGEALLLVGGSGEVFDRVIYTDGKKGQVMYFSGYSGEYNLFSPKNTNNLSSSGTLTQPSGAQDIKGCGIDQQRTTTYTFGGSLNLRAMVYNGTGEDMGTAGYTCRWEYGDGHQTSETCNPGFFTYTKPGLYIVSLRIMKGNSVMCLTKSTINYPEISTHSSLSSLSGSGISALMTGSSLTHTSGQVAAIHEPLPGYIKELRIVGVFPNPKGKDADRERILIKGATTASSVISGLTLTVSKKSYLLDSFTTNTTKEHIFTGAFGFHNSKGCIDLSYKKTHIDTFCYEEAQEDEWIWGSGVGSQASQHISKASPATAARTSSSSKISSTKATPKTAKTKTSTSTKTKATTKTTTKSAAKSTTKTQEAKDKKIEQLTKEIRSTERVSELQKNYIDLFTKEIQPYQYLFSGSKIQTYERAYRLLLAQAKQSDTLHREKFTIPVTDIRNYVALAYNILPIEADLSIPYTQIWENTVSKFGYIRSRVVYIN